MHTTPKALAASLSDRERANATEDEGMKNKATNTVPVNMLVSTLDNMSSSTVCTEPTSVVIEY